MPENTETVIIPDPTGVVVNPSVIVPEEDMRSWRSYCHSGAIYACMDILRTAIPYAQQGHPRAMFLIGYLLRFGVKSIKQGENYLNPDRKAALPWLIKAYEGGEKEAYNHVLEIYEALSGPEGEGLVYEEKLNAWLELGLEKDEVLAYSRLFYRYKEAQDWTKAFPLLVKLAEFFGENQSRLELAQWYEEGKGCEKKPKKAFELAEYVYNHSSAISYDSVDPEEAADLLVRYLYDGIGCEADPERADKIRRHLREEDEYLDEVMTR